MKTIEYKVQQAEMIYLGLLNALRDNDIEYDEKYEQLIYEIDTRHEAVDLLDLLDELYDFIIKENGFEFNEDDEEE